MPILNASPLALPDNAYLEGAWQESIAVPNPAPGQIAVRTTPGETYEQLLTGAAVYVADAAVVNRIVLVTVQDPNGRLVGAYPCPTAQTASTTDVYSIVAQGGQSFATSGGDNVIAMPAILLLPGYKVTFGSPQADAGDQVQSVTFVMLRIPTGAPQQQPEPLMATPLQV